MYTTQGRATAQTHAGRATELLERMIHHLGSWLTELDAHPDKRLVRTLVRAVMAIITFRHSKARLLLSELGGCITTLAQAPAGTKRSSNRLLNGKAHLPAVSGDPRNFNRSQSGQFSRRLPTAEGGSGEYRVGRFFILGVSVSLQASFVFQA